MYNSSNAKCCLILVLFKKASRNIGTPLNESRKENLAFSRIVSGRLGKETESHNNILQIYGVVPDKENRETIEQLILNGLPISCNRPGPEVQVENNRSLKYA